MLPLVSHVEYIDGTDRRKDGRTVTRLLHYAFRSQHNKQLPRRTACIIEHKALAAETKHNTH